jgi:hypothetical protein
MSDRTVPGEVVYMVKKKDTVKVARDARDGKFVTKDQLKKRPASTISQTVKKPKKSAKK